MAPKVGKSPSEIIRAVIKASGADAATALGEIGMRVPKTGKSKPMNEEELKTKERLGTFKVEEAKH
jgi:hypothetical protein